MRWSSKLMPSRSAPCSEPAGEHAILLAGCHIARGMIVGTDPGDGVHQDQRFEDFTWMHDGQGQGADRDDIDADDAVLGIQPADQELLAIQSCKQGRSRSAAPTEVRSGEEGGMARFCRTSVTRYRGIAYGLHGFGCRGMFSMPCEP